MEAAQLIYEEWDSLSGQFTAEEADFMTQLLHGNTNCSYFASNVANANSMCFSQVSSTDTANSGIYFSDHAIDNDSLSMFYSPQYLDDNLSKQMNYESIAHEGSCLEPVKLVLAPHNNLQAKREHEMMMFVSEEDRTENMENPAKRFRSSNASMEVNEGTCHEVSNLCRKSRARNGPATDSQSIYARVSVLWNLFL